LTFLRWEGTRAELAITAVRDHNDTPAAEALQAARAGSLRRTNSIVWLPPVQYAVSKTPAWPKGNAYEE
jgi:hypothetical protein